MRYPSPTLGCLPLPISLRSLSPTLAATFMPPRGRPTLVVLSLVTSSSVASFSSASSCDAAACRSLASEPQRVPVHSFSSYPLPCRARSRAGPFGLGPPSRPHLCGACTWQRRLKIPAISSSSRYPLRRGFAAPIQAPRAWFADTRISLCASLRLPARRLLRARREAHPIGDRIEAPVQARQRRRRRPPEPSTRCRTLRNPFCAHAAGRSFHSSV